MLSLTLRNDNNSSKVLLDAVQAGRALANIPYLKAATSPIWKEDTANNELVCDVEYPDAAEALINVAARMDPQDLKEHTVGSSMGYVRRLDTSTDCEPPCGYDEVNTVCAKTRDGRWERLEYFDYYAHDTMELWTDPVIPRKVVAVFAERTGVELYNATEEDEFDVQIYDTRNWENSDNCNDNLPPYVHRIDYMDNEHQPYFVHRKYREKDYGKDDAEEDALYPMQISSFPWLAWMHAHGPLIVLYRQPLKVATYDIPIRRGSCYLFECTCANDAMEEDDEDDDEEGGDGCQGCTYFECFKNDMSEVKRSHEDRMVAAVHMSLDEDERGEDQEYEFHIPDDLLSTMDTAKLCQMIYIADAWSALPLQEQLLFALARSVDNHLTVVNDIIKCLSGTHRSLLEFATEKRLGEIALMRSIISALLCYTMDDCAPLSDDQRARIHESLGECDVEKAWNCIFAS